MSGFFSRRREARDAAQATTSLRPQPPLAKRLNRNALTVAAVIMGMTVLTAIVILSPGRTSEKGRAPDAALDDIPPVPPRPAFLDEPVRQPATSTAPPPPPTDSAPAVSAPPPIGNAPSSGEHRRVQLDTQEQLPAPLGETEQRDGGVSEDPRARAYQSALASPVVAGTGDAKAAAAGAENAQSPAMDEEQLVTLGDSIMRSALRAGSGTTAPPLTATPSSSGELAPGSRSRSFATRAVESAGEPKTIAHLEPAGSPYTVNAGTVIPGLLITGINSDLPGEIVGQVSRPVYDSRTQRHVLIPKGSRLIGTYDNQVAAGQGRLLVAWTRLIFPDGRSMRLPGLAVADAAGQSGARDKVDNHWRRVFGNALLLSAISAGAQLSQPSQATVLSTPSAGQVAAGAVGQELSGVALEILRRGMDVAPTITIRAGQPFNVFLSGDLVFDGPVGDDRR